MRHTILLIYFLLCPLFAAAFLHANPEEFALPPKLETIAPAKLQAISSREIEEIATLESKEHAVEGFLANPTAVDCFAEVVYHYTGGRYVNEPIHFRLRCPPQIQHDQKYPLIVWFHGLGESGDDNKRQLAHLQKTLDILVGKDSLDFFMLATQCPGDNKSWANSLSDEEKGDAPITITQEIFEILLTEYPIDKERISVAGLSSGGAAVWQFAQQNPHRLVAVVPISTSPPGSAFSTDAFVWAFNCTDDKQAKAETVRPVIAAINQAGGVAYLTEVVSSQHDAWTHALTQMKVIRWMVLQKRGTQPYPPPGVLCQNRSFGATFFHFGLPVCCFAMLWFVRRKLC